MTQGDSNILKKIENPSYETPGLLEKSRRRWSAAGHNPILRSAGVPSAESMPSGRDTITIQGETPGLQKFDAPARLHQPGLLNGREASRGCAKPFARGARFPL